MPIRAITVTEITPFDLTYCCVSCGNRLKDEANVRSCNIPKALDFAMRHYHCKNCEGGNWNYPFCTAYNSRVRFALNASTWKNMWDTRMCREAIESVVSRYTCVCKIANDLDCYYVSMTRRRAFFCNRCDKPYIPEDLHERKDVSFGFLRSIQLNCLEHKLGDVKDYPRLLADFQVIFD